MHRRWAMMKGKQYYSKLCDVHENKKKNEIQFKRAA